MVDTTFWLLLALLAALAGLWPFGPYQLTLLAAKKLRSFPALPAEGETDDNLTFGLCMCAYNEEDCIEEKILDLLALKQRYGDSLSLYIFDDCSNDQTRSILKRYKDQIDITFAEVRTGKTKGMARLVAKTKADIIIYTDANVRIDLNAIDVLRRYFSDPSIGCVGSNLAYTNETRSATAKMGGLYWRFNEWSKKLETQTGSFIGADGSLYAIRRSLHEPVKNGLIDDLVIGINIVLQGFRAVRAEELKAYEQHLEAPEKEFRRKIRIANQCMAAHFEYWHSWRGLDGWNLYKYVAHRLLRWTGGFFLLTSLLFFTLSLVSWLGWLATIFVYVLSATGFGLAVMRDVKPAPAILNILLAFLGNMLGAVNAFRGVSQVTWDSSARSREKAGSL